MYSRCFVRVKIGPGGVLRHDYIYSSLLGVLECGMGSKGPLPCYISAH
jgi:hypothetical protein